MTPVFLTAEWRHLAMVNYEIDPGVLQPLVPPGTELDEWGGRCYVSVVGFLFLRTKVLGVTIPFHRDFEEINLRFYVRRQTPEGWRRGVVFVKEVVPRRAIACVARWLYNENYVALPTQSKITLPGVRGGSVAYGWLSNQQAYRLRVETAGAAGYPAAGSEAEFITEHYWGYAVQRDGLSVEYAVEHPQWRVWAGTNSSLEGDVAGFYGEAFGEALRGRPTSAFVAEGSPIVVRRGRPLTAR